MNHHDIEGPERLKARGFDVPAEVLDAAGTFRETLPPRENEKLRAAAEGKREAAAGKIVAFLDKWCDARLKPGKYNGQKLDRIGSADLKPCGEADGVIYFDAVKGPRSQHGQEVIVKPGLDAQAIRYVRPGDLQTMVLMLPPYPKAKDTHGSLGLHQQEFFHLTNYCPGIKAAEAEILAARELRGPCGIWCFLSLSPNAIDCVQPKHANRWRVRKAEEGVWCIFYV